MGEHAIADRWSRPVLLAYRWLQNYAALILVPSVASSASYATRGIREHQLAVMPNAIDIRQFDQIDRATTCIQIRQKLQIPENAYLIGTVCRLETVKGLPNLLKAVKGLPVYLVIAGEGSERTHLGSIIQQEQLGDRVQLLGSRTDVPELLTAFDLFVLPSLSESFGIAVAEALVAGVPVVATDVGGVSEMTCHSKYAYLVPPGDVEALVEAIEWAMEHPRVAKDRALDGAAFIRNKMAVHVVAHKQHMVYQDLISRARRVTADETDH
jgi:glycosyltransferase involved in cell wall biosynthesis